MAAPHDNQGIEELLDNEGTTAGALVLTAFMTTATQPLTCVRLLMQVGHEPIPPTPSKTFLGTKVLRLPSFFQYANHIKKLDGWSGLYRGLLPRVYSSMIGTLVNNTVLQAISSSGNALVPIVNQENKTSQEEFKEFAVETCKQTVAKCSALIISHPFYDYENVKSHTSPIIWDNQGSIYRTDSLRRSRSVSRHSTLGALRDKTENGCEGDYHTEKDVISVRMMVQFVGKETIYSGLRASIIEIYDNEGILGFFSGIIPRLIGEILSLWLYRGACFLVSKYAVDSEVSRRKEVQVYTNGLFQYAAGVVTYPFVLVSHMMIVNHVGLAAGEAPAMPVFSGWTDCFKYLRKTGNLWRGSSMFRRTVRQVTGQ